MYLHVSKQFFIKMYISIHDTCNFQMCSFQFSSINGIVYLLTYLFITNYTLFSVRLSLAFWYLILTEEVFAWTLWSIQGCSYASHASGSHGGLKLYWVFLLLQAHADGKDLKTENLGQSFLSKTWNFERVLKQSVTQNIKILWWF
jgi:hypothetical protein